MADGIMTEQIFQILTFLEQHKYTVPYDLQPDAVVAFVHAPGKYETLFGHSETATIIQSLRDFGFEQIARFDCRERSVDQFDSIIYHYRLPLALSKTQFFKDWLRPEFRYCRFQVLEKYGVTAQ